VKINALKSLKAEGGLLNHAQIACNGNILIMRLPEETFFFSAKEGQQILKSTHKEV
jgi:hypothetical protein